MKPKQEKPVDRYNQVVGGWGEQVASRYLEAHGVRILAHNVRTPYGEIDLVGQDKQGLIFVEVKTRTTTNFGLPETGITPKKREHLLAAVAVYFQEHPEQTMDWRFDVIAVLGRPEKGDPQVEWFENALS